MAVTKGRRRAHGEGSVYQRSSDGLWVGMVDLGRKENGKRNRKPVYGKTEAAALEKMKRARERADANLPIPSQRGTVSDFMERWLDGLEESLRPKTIAGYRDVFAYYIKPYVGHIALAKLEPEHVEDMLVALRKKGLSPRTRRLARAVLRRALAKALERGKVTRNVAALVDGPRGATGTTPAKRTMTIDEAKRLLAAAKGTWLGYLIIVGMSLGLRPGESLGIRWDDIDWDEKVVRVRNVVGYVDGKPLFEEDTKNAASSAPVDMPDVCIAALKAQRARQSRARLKAGERWEDNGLVFATREGKPLDQNNVRRALSRVCRAAGLGHWTPHEVWRHTAASILFALGVPVEVVSKILRHSSVRVTREIYIHVMRPAQKAASSKMDTALGGAV